MKKKEVAKLELGLYKLNWKSGGFSFASVGQTHSGKRWHAPCNWTSSKEKFPLVASTYWKDVKSVEFIIDYRGIRK